MGKKTTLQGDFLRSWQCGLVVKEASWRQMWVWPPAPLLLCSVTLEKLHFITSSSPTFFLCGAEFQKFHLSYLGNWVKTVVICRHTPSAIYFLSLYQVNVWKPYFYCMTPIPRHIALRFILNNAQSLPFKSLCHLIPLCLFQFASLRCRATPFLSAPADSSISACFAPGARSLLFPAPIVRCPPACFTLTLLSKMQPTSWPSFLLISLIFVTMSSISLWHQVSFPWLSLCSILPCTLMAPPEYTYVLNKMCCPGWISFALYLLLCST